jgi:hypothetical protein
LRTEFVRAERSGAIVFGWLDIGSLGNYPAKLLVASPRRFLFQPIELQNSFLKGRVPMMSGRPLSLFIFIR